jgi:uncharacterized protein
MSRIVIMSVFVAGALFSGPASAGDKNQQRAAACAQQPTLTEQTICLDKGLTRQDGALNQAYAELRNIASASQFKDIRAEQLVWIKERNACGADTACLNDTYTDRITVLEQAQENIAYAGSSHDQIASAELSCTVQSKLNSPTSSKEKVTVTFKNKSRRHVARFRWPTCRV